MTRSGSEPFDATRRLSADVCGLSLRRWIALCACAEAIGMTAAALAAKLSQRLLGDDPQVPATATALTLVVAGGLIEGSVLGALQAGGLRRSVPRLNTRRWLYLTAAVAGLGWAAASAPNVLNPNQTGPQPALPLVLAGALVLGATMGVFLGAAQATTLRSLVRRPGRWVLGNALAWPPTMAVIFMGATTPDSTWSTPSVTALGTATGVAAGAVLGIITGRFLPSPDEVTARTVANRNPGAEDESS